MCEPKHWSEPSRLRHSAAARWLRRLAYRAVTGDTVWPLTFRACPTPPPEEPTPNLYFHLPFCRTLCPHCPYLKQKYEESRAAQYAVALLSEVDDWLSVSASAPLETVWFGGGTPALSVSGIAKILDRLAPRLTRQTAVGIELHPADVTPGLVATLRTLNVSRVSLGVESLQPEVLRRLGRRVAADAVLRGAALLTDSGFDCVDVNLIYGVEQQRPEDVLRDAETLIGLGVDQISAYPLFSFRHTNLGVRADVQRFRERDRIGRRLRELCAAHGLQPSSVWSFNRLGRPVYSTVTLETFRGFGAGAASRGVRSFRFHTFDIGEYMNPGGARMALELTAGERFFKAHWLYWKLYQLRVPVKRYEELFNASLAADFQLLRTALTRLGWMKETADEWQLTPRGADWIHRAQQLYSLSWIDLFWVHCQREPWPQEVHLL